VGYAGREDESLLAGPGDGHQGVLTWLGLARRRHYGVYPVLGRFFKVTPLRKVGMGLLLTVLSFVAIYAIDLWIAAGEKPSLWWQIGAFVIITAGEVMVSITTLEYSYTQAPTSMKSFVMSLYMLSVSLGNVIAAAVNGLISSGALAEHLTGPNYFLFFAVLLGVVTIVFAAVARFFPEKTYIQGSAA
jgi:proton-dependent oligopeptide transporter, POT family